MFGSHTGTSTSVPTNASNCVSVHDLGVLPVVPPIPNPAPTVTCVGAEQLMSVHPNCPDGLEHPPKLWAWKVTFCPEVRPLNAHVAMVMGNTPFATVKA